MRVWNRLSSIASATRCPGVVRRRFSGTFASYSRPRVTIGRVKLAHGRLQLSPSDLSAFVACPHLTALELCVARGLLDKPYRVNPHADLIRSKGEEHELAFLRRLGDSGRRIMEIAPDGRSIEELALETEAAMASGADVIYQAVLADGDWRGFADFLVRVDTPSDLGSWSYEVLDTKLARHARPEHVLQLCFYTEQVERIQGLRPVRMGVVAGTGEEEWFRPDDYLAYYRTLRRRFEETIAGDAPTYPWPVEHCGLCEFLAVCQAQWETDDHLTLVAGVSRLQAERLAAFGIGTLEALALADPETRVPKVRPPTFQRLRHQAELQLHRRHTGAHRVEHLPLEDERGFALLPEPSPGDVWLDLEGHPWFEPARGLEYLFGWVYLDDGEPRYECLWAVDRAEEKRAFARLMDWLVERRRRFPRMHVYHYAPYERSAIRRLMGEHGTREDAVDEFLREEVLVDLYRVVRQSLRASLQRYSIKNLEELYGFVRKADVGGGTESVVAFERWLELGDDSVLDGIRDYNREDCESLYALHRWLLAQRPPGLPWHEPRAQQEPDEEVQTRLAALALLKEQLLEGRQEGEPPWLLAQLLEYHRREARPQWWEYFFHLSLDDEELLDDGDTIGGLELVERREATNLSFDYVLSFPAQEHKISGRCRDPAAEKAYDVAVDNEHGTVTLRRAKNREDEPLPRALIPDKPISTRIHREAVQRFAREYADGDTHRGALVDVLERRPPRARLAATPVDAALSLRESYLFVQGPPGSGKTYTGARLAVALMREGRRVGVTALSHKAINKFLEEVRDAAREDGFSFRGRKKADDEGAYRDDCVDCTDSNDEMLDPELQLLAGTSWLFSRPELDGHLDTLFVDEAGQLALADAIAVGTAARNLVLLGDPNQLPQVSQGSHPPGANASVLSHLLGGGETVRPEMGIFLAETWRLRPEVCDFVSEAFYEGRLRPNPKASSRSIGLGNGVRWLPVEHAGHTQASPEEAAAVRDEIERLAGAVYDDGERRRRLTYEDVIVVAPYNAHVRCLREHLPEAVRVGTVDRFQGQEAAVSFFTMATSSGEDAPRGLEFLFSRNRLNVAVSRAKCLAYLVCSPRLLDVRCRTTDQMRLANALCRFVELGR
jgi:predicted RecB family nuclease